MTYTSTLELGLVGCNDEVTLTRLAAALESYPIGLMLLDLRSVQRTSLPWSMTCSACLSRKDSKVLMTDLTALTEYLNIPRKSKASRVSGQWIIHVRLHNPSHNDAQIATRST